MYSKILVKVATFCPRNTSHVREGRTEEVVGGSDGMFGRKIPRKKEVLKEGSPKKKQIHTSRMSATFNK